MKPGVEVPSRWAQLQIEGQTVAAHFNELLRSDAPRNCQSTQPYGKKLSRFETFRITHIGSPSHPLRHLHPLLLLAPGVQPANPLWTQ